jgi:signal transduction histidine kinase
MKGLGARLIVAGLLALIASTSTAAPTPPTPTKRVLVIHSYPPDFEGEFGDKLRAEVDTQLSGQQLDLHESWLSSARLTGSGEDPAFADYLNSLFGDRAIDLVIAIGSPAANFLQRYRQQLFPSTPELLTMVEQRRIEALGLRANQVAVPYSGNSWVAIDHIFRLLPQTTSLVVVTGNSPIEQYSVGELRASAQALTQHPTVTVLNTVRTFDELLQRLASLPPHSAIYYEPFFPDINGMPADEYTAFAKVHAVANAPLFSPMGEYFGKGTVGGPMLFWDEYARQTANVAGRILGGEALSAIKVPVVNADTPKFDSRELKRWGIRVDRLPPGSDIEYVKPTAWQQYHWQIASAVSLIIIEALLILSLLYEHRRRRNAEVKAHRRLLELARMNRRSTVGELSASIAHELNQPLTAILANTEAAGLTYPAPWSAQDLRDLMADIRHDAMRAAEVIKRLRQMLADIPIEPQEIDLNEVIRETFEFLTNQALARRVSLSTELAPQLPRIAGDRIQLQQVIMNLVLNAVDAMGNADSRERRIVARTGLLNGVSAEVSIEDTGPGIPDNRLQQIFEPFFTTKEGGMGMGLSIARTIVESHGGQIWAETRNTGGAAFRFTVPLSTTHSAMTNSGPRRKTARLATPAAPLASPAGGRAINP